VGGGWSAAPVLNRADLAHDPLDDPNSNPALKI
jgi:hypothetical protein